MLNRAPPEGWNSDNGPGDIKAANGLHSNPKYKIIKTKEVSQPSMQNFYAARHALWGYRTWTWTWNVTPHVHICTYQTSCSMTAYLLSGTEYVDAINQQGASKAEEEGRWKIEKENRSKTSLSCEIEEEPPIFPGMFFFYAKKTLLFFSSQVQVLREFPFLKVHFHSSPKIDHHRRLVTAKRERSEINK